MAPVADLTEAVSADPLTDDGQASPRPSAPPVAAVARDRYRRHWAITVVLLVAGVVWMRVATRESPVLLPVPAIPPGEGVTWFLMLRIPEAPPQPEYVEEAKARLANWLQGLRQAGFQPMPLSAVLARLDRGLALPRKTVVLLLYPGYRHTYEAFAPVLAQQRFPAVWLTDWNAIMAGGDRRYLSRHAIGRMERSGLWDLGWYRGPTTADALAFELARWASPSGHPRPLMLNLLVGHKALNQWSAASERSTSDGSREAEALAGDATAATVLYRLTVDPRQTTGELIDRLLAEAPVEEPSYLTVRQIGSRRWGVALEADASDPEPFRLAAPLDARTASVGWSGTSGKDDFQLRLTIRSRSGDLWVLLRADRAIGQGIRVGFTEEGILVERGDGRVRTRLAAVPWPAGSGTHLRVTMVLRGPRFLLSVNHKQVVALDAVRDRHTTQGSVGLSVYDKVRGAAAVEVADMTFVPLRTPATVKPAMNAGPPAVKPSPVRNASPLKRPLLKRPNVEMWL